MNDLDVILATVEELREYLNIKRKCGKAACIRRIKKFRPDIQVLDVIHIIGRPILIKVDKH